MRRLLVALVLTLTACAAGQVPPLPESTTRAPISQTTTAAPTTAPPGTTEPPIVPEPLEGFEIRSVTIEDGDLIYSLTVAVADESAERNQGLMGIADLGDLDGMLFVWPAPTTSTFWMKDTLIPLDIAFFNSDGGWVNNFTMQPCLDEDCQNYSAGGTYLYAIEVPDAGFAALTPAALLNTNI